MPRRKPTASIRFQDLPDDAFVREPELLRLFPIGRSTLWRQIELGEFPAPARLGPRIRAWRVGGVRAKLASLDAEP